MGKVKNLHLVFNEVHDPQPVIRNGGVLITNIPALKMSKSARLGVFGGGNYSGCAELEKTLSERLTFSPDFHVWTYRFDEYSEIYKKYFDFYKKKQAFYHDAFEIRDLVVVNSLNNVKHNSFSGRLAEIMAGQLAIQSGLPFAIDFDAVFERLDHIKTIFLPGIESMSDQQCARIEKYVKDGGGLVVTDRTAMKDEWARNRPVWGLKNIYGFQQPPETWYQTGFGKGRAVSIPSILPTPLPASNEWGGFDDSCCVLPENSGKIFAGIRWTAKENFTGQIFFRTSVPPNY